MATKGESNRGIWIATAVISLLIIVGGFFAWRFLLDPPPAVPTPVAPPPTAVVDAGSGAVNLAEGDALLRDAAGELSTEAIFVEWLGQPDLVRRLVSATFAVSQGESPRPLLAFLQPKGIFTVDEVKEPGLPGPKTKPKGKAKGKKPPPPPPVHSFMNAASTGRYDTIARVIGSVDTARLGRLYLKLRPFAESAFREVAPADKKLQDVYGAAVDHLAATPLSDAPLEVVPFEKAVGYRFKDPKLEGLSAAQKHLLRMGPANAKLVLKKLQDFRSALSAVP